MGTQTTRLRAAARGLEHHFTNRIKQPRHENHMSSELHASLTVPVDHAPTHIWFVHDNESAFMGRGRFLFIIWKPNEGTPSALADEPDQVFHRRPELPEQHDGEPAEK